MNKTIKTIISSGIAAAWVFCFTFSVWFTILAAVSVGAITYFAASCEEKETRCDNEDSKQ